MYEKKLKSLVALLIVVGHVGVFAFLVILWQMGGYTVNQVVTLSAIIAPLFAAFTSSSIDFLIDTSTDRRRGSRWAVAPTMVVVLFPICFFIAISGALYSKALSAGGIQKFDDLVRIIGVIEASFAVYLGQITKRLFKMANGAE